MRSIYDRFVVNSSTASYIIPIMCSSYLCCLRPNFITQPANYEGCLDLVSNRLSIINLVYIVAMLHHTTVIISSIDDRLTFSYR